MNFDQAFEFVFKEEGGYVNDPSDSGGETKYGISKRAHPGVDVKSLTKITCKPLYRVYWENVRAELFPDNLRLQLFDFGFTSGAKTSIRLAQRLAGVKPDGKVGTLTINAAKKLSPDDIYAARVMFYERLADRRPKDKKYLKGWKARSLRALKQSV